jgi:hypothetical protein
MADLIDSPDVFGSTIFCDDTRIEAAGKLIHIGVYRGAMTIHVPFPVSLPTFSFVISLSQRISVFDPKITFRVFLPGDPDDASSDEASIVSETNEDTPGDRIKRAATTSDTLGIPDEHRKFIRSYATLRFNALELKQPGQIKVRADIGGKRYRIGSISVVAAPAPTPTT